MAAELLSINPQPNGTESHLRTTLTLNKRRWTFDFYTNAINDAWHWDLTNDAGQRVLSGQALTLGKDLLYRYRYTDVPPGQLFCWDVADALGGRDPKIADFRDGLARLYYEPAE